MEKSTKIIIGVTVSFIVAAIIGVTIAVIAKVRKNNKAKAGSPNKTKTVLFIGDSLTAANPSYAEFMQTTKGYSIKKLAVVGISTNKMLPMLQTELQTNKYDMIVVFGGYNNNYAYGTSVSGNLKKTETELQQMYDMAKAKGAKVVAITPPSSTGNINYNADRQQFHNELNNWILKSNADYKIDLYSLETGGKNNTKPLAGMTVSDGQHLSANAHKLLANEIIKEIS